MTYVLCLAASPTRAPRKKTEGLAKDRRTNVERGQQIYCSYDGFELSGI